MVQERNNITDESIREENEEVAIEQTEITRSITVRTPDGTQNITTRQELEDLFNTAIIQYFGNNPASRPRLPKLKYNYGNNTVLNEANEILKDYITDTTTIENIHSFIYCMCVAVITKNGQKLISSGNKPSKNHLPMWEKRLKGKIEELRKIIGPLQRYFNGERSQKIIKTVTKHVPHVDQQDFERTIHESLDNHKQKLMALSKRLARYKESQTRKEQNQLFQSNEKKFYRNLAGKGFDGKPPNQEQLINYWSELYSKEKSHNKEAVWLQNEVKACQGIPEMNSNEISLKDVQEAIRNTANWKSPGIDSIQNFWYKKFHSTHKFIAAQLTTILNNPRKIPKFLTMGITYLLPKDADTENPANYRPITCLPTLTKFLTSILATKIQSHMEYNNILTIEQKGCRPNAKGAKEQLIIDEVILGQAREKKRDLNIAYIDYKKAFDSVPHTWLTHVLQIYKVDPKIIKFLKISMKDWKTKLNLKLGSTEMQSMEIPIKTGIFQGDSLSALWFCIALNPLSRTLQNTGYGFRMKHQMQSIHIINHLFYMDDLKLYAATPNQLQSLLQTTKTISEDIGMQFGMNKCKAIKIKKGKIANETEGICLSETEKIQMMSSEDTYKYLGIAQSNKIDHTNIKKHLTDQYKQRLKTVLKTKLTAKNMVKAINTYAIPILTYSFGVIKWSKTDLESLNRMTRTNLTKFRAHHPSASLQRITLPRSEGGRGILDIRNVHYTQIKQLKLYFLGQQEKPLYKSVVKCDKYSPLNMKNETDDPQEEIIQDQEKLRQWEIKEMHGRYKNTLQQEYINKKASISWLTRGKLFIETEGFLIAIQDQVMKTKNYEKYILKQITDDKCRKCNTCAETIEHITSGCSVLAPTLYLKRHNQLAGIIHQKLMLKYNLITHESAYYTYQPNAVEENQICKIYWDKTIVTDATIINNRPDIVLILKEQKVTYLLDISVPADNNILTKYNEKITKYTALAHEIKDMWHQQKVIIVPFIISTNGVIPKNFIENLKLMGIEEKTYIEAQKSVLLNTGNIVRSVLSN